MSFVKKAIKKVVKTVKKIVRSKVFKWIVIAAAVFFTAGVAAGGFAAFSGVSTVGGFFTAVGQTIATGASAIAGGLGFQGASTSLASYGGAAADAAGLSAASILTPVTVNATTIAGGATGMTAAQASAMGLTQATTQAAGSGFFASAKAIMGKKVLGDTSLGQLAAAGITTSMTEAIKNKGSGKEFPNGYVAGGLMRGGSAEAPEAISYEFGGPPSAGAEQQVAQQQQAPQEESTVAAQLAQGETEQASPANRIQALIRERGPLNPAGNMNTGPGFSGGLMPQEQQVNPAMLVNVPEPQARPERRFTTGASQLEYDRRRGLV